MSAIYSIDWEKYRNVSFSSLLALESEFIKNFHTCPEIMKRKKQLEKAVRKTNNFALKKHFKTPFKLRKKGFYQAIVYEIFQEGTTVKNRELTDLEKKVCELTKDILFIYSVKEEDRERLDDLLDTMQSHIDHEQEMQESMIEEWRGID